MTRIPGANLELDHVPKLRKASLPPAAAPAHLSRPRPGRGARDRRTRGAAGRIGGRRGPTEERERDEKQGPRIKAGHHGLLLDAVETTPTFAIVSPFVIDGTARMNVTTPATGALASKIRPTGIDHHMDWETLTHAWLGAHGL